jgi:hypothetical protein
MSARAQLLARAVRAHPVVIEGRSAHRCAGGVHSYLGDGRVVCWQPPPEAFATSDESGDGGAVGESRAPAGFAGSGGSRASGDPDHDRPVGWAIDAELSTQPVPAHVAARWRVAGAAAQQPGDAEQFWPLWCATEALAKLSDVPIVVLLRSGPVTASPARREGLEMHWLVTRTSGVVVVHAAAWTTTTPSLT